ncbi:MAG: accessory gene regulator B family protein [Bacillota bacterium]|nr:accessory gene regulator B family protein [Bacillota bacterium]
MEVVAKALTDRMIRYFGFSEERRDLLAFGVTYILLFVIDTLTVVLAGILVGAFGLTLVVALTSAVFRSLTGGAHFSDPWTCAIASAVIAAGLGSLAAALTDIVPFWLMGIVLVVAGLAGVTIHRYAPVDSPAKPISPPQKAKLRRVSWVALAGWVIIMGCVLYRGGSSLVAASALGLIWQVGTLTPGGARFYHLVNRALGAPRKT